MTPIAVVGIDCRFPGAPDKDAFWRLLMDGVVTDTDVPSQRWDIDTYYHPDGVAGSMNTRRAHFIDDVDAFDNDFFGIAPVEAAALDPQQRLLLQASWRALEDAGIDPRSLAGTPTGVFVGMMSSEWGILQMLDFAGLTAFRGTGSGYFMTANRISYHLNLTGPSMAVDSACSSSLMAVHQGCAALRSGETDTVIAAGANLLLTPALSIFYTQAGLSAPDGRCKPFGRSADGIGRGEGVAAVVLRRLDDAVVDGQPIYAVVKSSVANHDGRSNGITAPNRRAQVMLMRRALGLAELEAGQIDFVEAHGTGTVLGDMIEANALGDIHKTRGGEPCLLGSVKGNIGHTEGSAGIAAFIKACLALHHRILPPTVFGDKANPRLRLDALGLRLADGPQELPANGARGAVSSFGLGGSNAHAVLESAPPAAAPYPGASGVLTLSAPSEQALRRNVASIATALDALDDQRLASWCRSTNVVKRSHRHRLVLQGNRGALVDGLREFLAGGRAYLASKVDRQLGDARRYAGRILRDEARLEGVQIGEILGREIRLVAPEPTHYLGQRRVGDERPVVGGSHRLWQAADAIQLTRNRAVVRHAAHHGFVQREPHISERAGLHGRPFRVSLSATPISTHLETLGALLTAHCLGYHERRLCRAHPTLGAASTAGADPRTLATAADGSGGAVPL